MQIYVFDKEYYIYHVRNFNEIKNDYYQRFGQNLNLDILFRSGCSMIEQNKYKHYPGTLEGLYKLFIKITLVSMKI